MKTFPEVIAEAARAGGFNLVFTQGMYCLMDDLERIVAVLRTAGVPFEVIGGVAVNAHLFEAHRSRTFVTSGVELLVERVPKIVAAAEAAGHTGRKIMGGFMLIRPNQAPEEAVHLLFVGEKARASHPLPNPEIHPEEKAVAQFGLSIPAAPLRDVVYMKLNSGRPKDEAHLEILDQCGLISPAIESELPQILRERLTQARSRYSGNEFDVEE